MQQLEERLQRVEENYYFQEKFIEELNAVVILQQEQIRTMQQELDELKKQIAMLRDLLDVKFENTTPPHYLEKIKC